MKRTRSQPSAMTDMEAKAFAAKNAALKAYCAARTEQESQRSIAAFQTASDVFRSARLLRLGFKQEAAS